MIKKYFSTLKGHFTLSALIMHLIMMPVLFAGVFYFVESNLRNNFVNQVRNDALILASFSESYNENALQYQEKIIEDSVVSGRLLAAQITNEKQQITRTWGMASTSRIQDEDFFFGEHGDTVFNIIIHRYDSKKNLRGEIFLSYDEQPTLDQISLTYRYGIYLSLAYIAITFLLTVLLGRLITNPIQQLRAASYDISMGHYEKEMKVETGIHDIQQLATTLEQMRHELVDKSNEMKFHAMHDNLTGLPNRLMLRHCIDQVLSTENCNNNTMALLMIDLDHFKEINDSLGHLTGDEVLKIAATRLLSCTRQSDTVARLGGDEFAIILPEVNAEAALNIAQKISNRLREDFIIDDNTLQVGASIGVALYPEHGKKFNEILHCADLAMYASKLKREGIAILYHEKLETKKQLS